MKKLKEYTVAIHVSRLKKMLKRKYLKVACPASWRLSAKIECRYYIRNDMWKSAFLRPCYICKNFVDVPITRDCPCYYYGEEKAREVTIQKIAEWEKNRRK